MPDSSTDAQREIEKELFEKYDKNIDRFFSLTKVIFIVFGFYLSIINYIYGKLDRSIFQNKSDPLIAYSSFILLIICIILTYLILIKQLLRQKCKFKRIDGLIQLREGEELKTNNTNLFSAIKEQNFYHSYVVILNLFSFSFMLCFIWSDNFLFAFYFSLIFFLVLLIVGYLQIKKNESPF